MASGCFSVANQTLWFAIPAKGVPRESLRLVSLLDTNTPPQKGGVVGLPSWADPPNHRLQFVLEAVKFQVVSFDMRSTSSKNGLNDGLNSGQIGR